MEYNNQDLQNIMSPENQMARTSFVLAIVAAISTFILPVYLPIFLGCVSFTFARLSMGYGDKMLGKAHSAVWISSATMVLNICILAISIGMIIFVPEYRAQFDQMMLQINGMTLEQMLESINGN